MTDHVPHKSRIPHWGWFLGAIASIVVVFVGIRFGLHIYRQKQMLAEFKARGMRVEATGRPNWLPSWIGDDLKAVFSSSISIDSFNDMFTDDDLLGVAGLTNLTGLGVFGTEVELRHVAGLTKLQSLTIRDPQLTDADLSHLRSLSKLESLDLFGLCVTDDGLKHLAGLKTLRFLGLQSPHITDAGILNLSGLTNLEWLDLRHTAITDAGVSHLAGMSKLKLINLGVKHVTSAGVAKLKAALPGCEIDWE